MQSTFKLFMAPRQFKVSNGMSQPADCRSTPPNPETYTVLQQQIATSNREKHDESCLLSHYVHLTALKKSDAMFMCCMWGICTSHHCNNIYLVSDLQVFICPYMLHAGYFCIRSLCMIVVWVVGFPLITHGGLYQAQVKVSYGNCGNRTKISPTT